MGLESLPNIQFVPVNPDEIRDSIITVYEAVSGRTLFPGDPVRLFLLSQAEIIIQQRILLNDAARMNLLRYARGGYLDHIGALVETPRLDAAASLVTIRFTLSAPQLSAVSIPQGTRVTPGNNLFFATMNYAEVAPGEMFVDVPVSCMELGTIGNGFVPGQINSLVDPIPFVASVSNTTESSGGADVEADEPYRNRIYTAPERFSVAGPAGSYEYWAHTANSGILDVRVHSPAAMQVEVVVLMAGGELPSPDVLDAVEAILSDRTIRPLTDQVTVTAPTPVNYSIDIEYWIDADNTTEATTIQQTVTQAVTDYILWQKTRIGRNINPSELVRRVMNAGARRVTVVEPSYVVLDNTEVAQLADPATDVKVTYGGIESD